MAMNPMVLSIKNKNKKLIQVREILQNYLSKKVYPIIFIVLLPW